MFTSKKREMLRIDNVSFSFGPSSTEVIDGISFSANFGEFIAIVGPSGCGKSTLLRIISGLIEPKRGHVLYMGKRISGPTKGISFVFQDFALLPWLTNLENVELGLSGMDMSDDEKRKKATELLESFGLGGFEESYPNVLSGGMKQRVGMARAIASEPKVLLMDEPFSALDELTASALRADVIDMLRNKSISVSCVIMVTHNVEEAVETSDKVIILSDKPTRIKEIEIIKLKRPRDKRSTAFLDAVDKVYAALAK